MFALLYLAICFITGYTILLYIRPQIFKIEKYTYERNKYSVSPFFLWIPAIGITGLFLVTWVVYILGNVLSFQRKPLLSANSIALFIFVNFNLILLYLKNKKGKIVKPIFLIRNKKYIIIEAVYLCVTLALTIWLMYYVFHAGDGKLYIGSTVSSDFAPHTGMIRSFSYSNNFPTQYPYFAGEDVKYHFMFQFLVGNLEFLGMRIDHAFNIPSILGMMFVYLLIYVLANKITGKYIVGILSAFLFTFRSSESLFTFLSEMPKGTGVLKALSENHEFIGYTNHENWGLWNLNVYANQRHLAICLAVLLFVIIMVLPLLYKTFYMLNSMKNDEENNYSFKDYFYMIFIDKSGWNFGNVSLAIFLGLFAGASGFFNGAVLIALLMILFFIAAMSRNRLDFVIIAVISGGLSFIQSKVFMTESSISPKFQWGFISDNPTFFGAIDYILKLIGLLAILVVVSFLYYKGIKRYLIFVFSVPFIFSFMVSLTIDVTVNHKYIMLSCMLLDIMVASFIASVNKNKDYFRYIGTALLIILLTATGIYDTYSIIVKNGEGKEAVYDLNNPVMMWVKENATAKDIFLTAPYSLSNVTLGGGMLYTGWPYYAWSAGYDTGYRGEQARLMYSSNDPKELMRLVKDNNIRFVVVDKPVRDWEEYAVNESNIANTFELVYSMDEGEWKFTIYDAAKPKVEYEYAPKKF